MFWWLPGPHALCWAAIASLWSSETVSGIMLRPGSETNTQMLWKHDLLIERRHLQRQSVFKKSHTKDVKYISLFSAQESFQLHTWYWLDDFTTIINLVEIYHFCLCLWTIAYVRVLCFWRSLKMCEAVFQSEADYYDNGADIWSSICLIVLIKKIINAFLFFFSIVAAVWWSL